MASVMPTAVPWSWMTDILLGYLSKWKFPGNRKPVTIASLKVPCTESGLLSINLNGQFTTVGKRMQWAVRV